MPTATGNAEVLNAQEAAELLGAHVETVRRLARKGGIPAFKVGKDWRFRKQALLTWSQSGHLQRSDAAILVVDEHLEESQQVCRSLENAGYRVASRSDGSEALAMIRDHGVSLLMLDLDGAAFNTLEFIKILRHNDAELPVVVMSDCKDDRLITAVLRQGPFILLPKPIDEKTLLSAVRMTLRRLLTAQDGR